MNVLPGTETLTYEAVQKPLTLSESVGKSKIWGWIKSFFWRPAVLTTEQQLRRDIIAAQPKHHSIDEAHIDRIMKDVLPQ